MALSRSQGPKQERVSQTVSRCKHDPREYLAGRQAQSPYHQQSNGLQPRQLDFYGVEADSERKDSIEDEKSREYVDEDARPMPRTEGRYDRK